MFTESLIVLVALLGVCRGDNGWITVPGSLTHVSISNNYMAGVNRNDLIYTCAQPCTGSWKNIPGRLRQLDVSDMEIWGVNSAQNIYKRPVDGSGAWIRISGKLKHVSASGNGYIWGVNRNDDIFICRKPCSGSWRHIPGKLKQIDGGNRFVFGVNSGNIVWRRAVDGSGGWTRIGTKKMKYVTVGYDAMFGITPQKVIFSCTLPCDTGNWIEMDPCFDITQVEAAANSLAATTTARAIRRFPIDF